MLPSRSLIFAALIGSATLARADDPPLAVLGAPIEIVESISTSLPPPDAIAPRASLRREFGEGIGYDTGYTYLEAFIPVLQSPGRSILFGDVRVINYDDARFWEAQVGGGARICLPNAVLGANVFYDGRNSDIRFWNQLGVGVEVLGRNWELRGNAYIPLGTQRVLVGDSGLGSPQFVGTSIAFDRTLSFESSMGGFDLEVGRRLPSWFEDIRTSAYLGYYHYDAERVQAINGVRGRLESWIGENVSLQLQVQNDAVNNTTVSGGVALHWGGVSRAARHEDPLAAKLGDRIVRAPDVVTQAKSETSKELAIDPATGKPVVILHVDSNAAPGGDGSVLHPYQTLADIQAGSGQHQILFAHAGSVFTDQGITLQPYQRFLGEGIDHYFTATQGTFLLPRATTNTAPPVITATGCGCEAPLAAIVLANYTEVAGFRIDRPSGIGIYGSNLVGATIDRNQIVSSTNLSLPASLYIEFLSFNGGSVSILNNTINSPAIVNPDNSYTTVIVKGNTLQTDGDNFGAFQLAATNGGVNNFQVVNNFATSRNPFAIAVIAETGATINLQFANNVAQKSSCGCGGFGSSPFLFDAEDGGTLNIEKTLRSNSPRPDLIPTFSGTYNFVPVGSSGFGPP